MMMGSCGQEACTDMPIPDQVLQGHPARQAERANVLKRAKLVFGGAVLDCTVLDLSASGARLLMGTPARLSGDFAVHMPGGIVHAARLSWSRGREIGLEFIGEPKLAVAAASLASASVQALRGIAPDRVLEGLRGHRHFDDPVLADAAHALADAYAALLSALQDRVIGSTGG